MQAPPEYVVHAVLDEDSEVTLYRARDRDGRSVLIKALKAHQPASTESESLRHEFEAARLIGGEVAVEVERLGTLDACPALIFHDAGGAPLSRSMGAPMALDRFFPLALGLADALAKLHARQIIYLGMSPHNIIVTPDQRVRLIAFGQAVVSEVGITAPPPARWPSSMWPYLSPEQAGRLGLLLDHRSDLYSLGVIYFQLVTGRLPFMANDLLGWSHCHCAVSPPPSLMFEQGVPMPVADIVSRLLAKLPERRYQSAEGLVHDLARCLAEWEGNRQIDPFPLGQADPPPPLRMTSAIYGRSDELAILKDALARAGEGSRAELVMIAGPPGIGKTEIVHQLRLAMPEQDMLFAAGKCDAVEHDISYGVLLRALDELIVQALEESNEESIAAMRNRLMEVLGVNAPLLVGVLPRLAQIIGGQKAPPELPLYEAERRFLLALGQLIGAFAEPTRPLVLFLDDLQWADTGALTVIEYWVKSRDVHHTLILGTFRSVEVDASHLLRRMMDRLRDEGIALLEMPLQPLAVEAVTRWVADSLHRPLDDAAPLGALIHDKTGGNPFFITQLVCSLYQEGLIHFSRSVRAWQWDLDAIQAKDYSDDVADLIAANIDDLAPTTQEALRMFACQGGTVDLATLSILLAAPEREVQARLEDAFAARLIARTDGAVRFLHDHILQVAYALTPPERRAETHLAIGRALLSHTSPAQLEGRVFDIVRHINMGASKITSSEERIRAAELNLMAGRKAQAAADHGAALGFFQSGTALLEAEDRKAQQDLAFDLHFALAQCRFVVGDLAAAEALCHALLSRALSPRAAAAVYALLVDLLVTKGASDAAVEKCLEGLRIFGVDLPPHPTDAQVDAAVSATLARLSDRPISTLLELPPMTDSDARAVCDLISTLHAPAAYTDWNLFWFSACEAVELSLVHGNTSSSASAYAALGLGLSVRYRRYGDAFACGDAAYRLAQRGENLAYRPRATFEFAALLSYLTLPIRQSLELLRSERKVAVTIGDQSYVCAFGCHIVNFRLFAGDHLDDVIEEAAEHLACAERAGYKLVRDIIDSKRRWFNRLRGSSGVDGRDDAAFEAYLEQDQIRLARFLYYTHELEARVVLGEFEQAVRAAERARPLMDTAVGYLEVHEYHFYAALAIGVGCPPAPSPEGSPCLELLCAHRDHLKGLAESCPANFAPHVNLISAEIARVRGDELAAERAYEQAIRAARLSGFVHIEGLASELCARFHRQRGFETIARAYFTQARDCYEVWGARAKVLALTQRSPGFAGRLITARAGEDESLDMLGILKASQAISSTLLLSDLHACLLSVVLEHAAAERGCLLLSQAKGLVLAAASGADKEAFGPLDRVVAPSRLPLSLCKSVLRSRKPGLLADAAESHRYMADPYFAKAARRSVLCLPIVRQDKVMGLLYLENNLIPGAFSGARLGVLDVLASQATIALENARLYTELQQENAERRRAEAFLRESQALLQSIIDNTTAIIFVKDTEGRYLLINRQYEDILHARREEAIGKTDYDMFTREQAESFREADRAVLAQGRAMEINETLILGDGIHDYLTVKVPLRDPSGKLYAVCGIATDITSIKRSEEMLRRSFSLLEATLESTADGILVVDRAGRIVQFNRRFVEMWHIPDEILAYREDARVVAFVFEQLKDPEEFARVLTGIYNQPDASSFDIVEFKDGRVFECCSQPQYLVGQVVGRVFSHRDVTARVRAEKQRDRLLEDEKRARAEAEEAVRLRDEFLSIASHELRTPLTSLQLAMAGLEQRLLQGMDLERARWAMGISKRQIRRLATLLDLLLDVSRLQVGKLELQRGEVDLGAVVYDVVAQLGDELARAGSAITVQVKTKVIGSWDLNRLEQVVTNLLTNAIKFGKGKPIEVTISVEGTVARLSVTDHGIGMPLATQTQLFERFQRGVSARHYGGLGLGLYITRTIVEAHGGRVQAKSEVGEGSTFTVELPLTPAEPLA